MFHTNVAISHDHKPQSAFIQTVANTCGGVFSFRPVQPSTVMDFTRQLYVRKLLGPDRFSARFLKLL